MAVFPDDAWTSATIMQFYNERNLNDSIDNSSNTCLDLSSDADTARSMLYNDVGFALVLFIMPSFAIFGVVANLAFLFVVFRIQSMRTTTNAYLANLAVADISFLISATVPALIQYHASPVIYDQFPIKAQGCASVNSVIFLFFYASVFMVFLVSLERYGAICRPLRQRVVAGKARTTKLIIGTWVTAVVFSCSVIPALSAMVKTCVIWPEGDEFAGFPPVIGQCRPLAQWVNYASNVLKMVPFFAAMFTSGYIYTKILIQLNKDIPGLSNRRRYNQAMNRALRSRKQIAVMLIATGVIFFVCQAPAQIATLARVVTDNTEAEALLSSGQRGVLQWVSRVLLFFNSAINPIVYNVTNARYRKAFMETFIRCRQKRKVTLNRVNAVALMYIPTISNKEQCHDNNSFVNHTENGSHRL